MLRGGSGGDRTGILAEADSHKGTTAARHEVRHLLRQLPHVGSQIIIVFILTILILIVIMIIFVAWYSHFCYVLESFMCGFDAASLASLRSRGLRGKMPVSTMLLPEPMMTLNPKT